MSEKALINRMSLKILSLIVTGGSLILFFFLPVFIFCLIAFVPSFVAAVVDAEDELTFSKSVFMCNFCGVLPIALKILATKMSLAQVFDLMQDPVQWLVVLGAAGIGWLNYLVVPRIFASIIKGKAEKRLQKIKTAKEALFTVWSEESLRGQLPQQPIEDDSSVQSTAA